MLNKKSTINSKYLFFGFFISVFLLLSYFLINHYENIIEFTKIFMSNFWKFLKGTNPVIFFIGMVVFPLFGVPISPFYILSIVYGVWFSILILTFGIILNVSLSYWIASGYLRPFIEQLIKKWDYSIPIVPTSEYARVTFITRIAPGVPLFVQNYLLGLARIPFKIYLVISWAVQAAYAIAFILVGQSLFSGNSGMAIAGISLLIIIIFVTKILKNHYAKQDRS